MGRRDREYEAVQEAVVGALGADEDEVTPDATLMDDLGAESIDLLDILFRIERSTGVKILAADLGAYIQGGISDDEFSDENDMIPRRGWSSSRRSCPRSTPTRCRGTSKPTR